MPVTPATDPTRPTTPSKAGITRNADGQQIIPSSQRPDGTTRREIKVRPGYRPPEDVEVYKNRTAEAWKQRGSGGVPGAVSASDSENKGDSAASNKNAKRKAARKKAKEREGKKEDDTKEEMKTEVKEVKEEVKEDEKGGEIKGEEVDGMDEVEEEVRGEAKEMKDQGESSPLATIRAASPKQPEQTKEEKEKAAKAIRKKIRQANDLKARKEGGESLLPEQLEKVIKLGELTRQLNALGFE